MTQRYAFTLLELSISIGIIGVLMGSTLVVMGNAVSENQHETNQDHIDAVTDALVHFKERRGYLPCPASLSVTQGTAGFGKEVNSGDCTYTVAPGGTSRIETSGGSGVWMLKGTVPVRDILLRDDFMHDEHGNRYTYAVIQSLTESGTFDAGVGGLIVKDGTTNNIITDGAYVVVSHGKEGEGAYSFIGGALRVACGATNLDIENCDADVTFIDAPFNDVTPGATYFSDLIRWKSKQSVLAPVAASSPSPSPSPSSDANWPLDEASGNALDSVGSNNLTETSGTIASAAGMIGTARDFEADDTEYFTIADNADLSAGDTDFTFSFWMKMESYGAAFPVVLSKGWKAGLDENSEYAFYYDQPSARMTFSVYNGTSQVVVKAANFGGMGIGTWHHVVGWHDAANNQIGIAINGGTENTTANSDGVPDGNADFILGASTSQGLYFDGLIDNVSFYRRVLTSQERTDLYDARVIGGTITGVTYSASSNPNGYTGQNDETKMRDGVYNASNSVIGTDVNDEWIQADFGSVKSVTKIHLAPISASFEGWDAAYLNGHDIQYWNGSDWVYITTAIGHSDGVTKTYDVSLSTSIVRVYNNNNTVPIGIGDFWFKE